MITIPIKYKENERTLLIFRHIPPIPHIKLALRARDVNPALDPGGSGKELVGKGSGTLRAGLAKVGFLIGNPFINQAKRIKTADLCSKLPDEIRYFFPQLSIKF